MQNLAASAADLSISLQAEKRWNDYANCFFANERAASRIPLRGKKPWTTTHIKQMGEAARLAEQKWQGTFPASEEKKVPLADQLPPLAQAYKDFALLINEIVASLASHDFSLLVEHHIIFTYLEKLIAAIHQLEKIEAKLAALRKKRAQLAASGGLDALALENSRLMDEARAFSLYLNALQQSHIYKQYGLGEEK